MGGDSRASVILRQLTLQESMDIAAGRRPPVGWADDFPQRGDVAATRYTSSRADTERLAWSASWLIVANGLVAGTIGFKGAPRNGELEIGYGVVPSMQRRGAAANALAQLLDVVKDDGLSITAKTAAWNIASQRVVEKAGFTRVERRMTDDDGEVTVWRREGPPTRGPR
jgi:RimJ/RimL family protein N-acetyltransferase